MINPECTSKIINNLDTSKATHQGHIPTKIIKDNKNLIHILLNNNAVNKDVFPDKLKHADTKPIYKTESGIEKEIYRPVSTLPNLPKYLNVVCMINLMITFIRYCQNIGADLEKGLAHSIAY